MSNINSSLFRKPTVAQGGLAGQTTLAGSSEQIFPLAAYGAIQERTIYNPNTTGSFWINLYGGTASVGGADCVEIPPKTGWSGSITNLITIIGTAAAPITWGER